MTSLRNLRWKRAFVLALALAVALAIGDRSALAQECPGDCDGSDAVSISELIGCADIALGGTALGACDACDVDGSTAVSIDELVAAVDAALNGCHVPSPSAVAHFALPPTGAIDWGEVPFPSDLYRDEGGVILIGALPTSTPETPLFSAMRDEVEARDGFCATCNVYFAIDGEIDPAALPVNDTASAADAVVLADADPNSPERGRLVPLRAEWNADRRLLAVRPAPGIALHRSRRYAAALTTALRAADESALGASEVFRQVRNPRISPVDPEVERARDVLSPAFDELERVGIGRNRIVALASFTTEDVTSDVLSARAAVQSGPPFDVTIDRLRRGVEIDELLGVPSEDRPGIDVPPAEGVAGTRSIVHDAIGDVITGSFFAPRIVSGSGTDIGTALRDERGRIAAGARERVPFVLTLPVGHGTQVPVVVAHHGFNASRVTGFASANTAARAGVAVLAIDAFQHGERAASAHDDVNAMRGDLPGPDGFAETSMLDLSARVFGLVGAAPGLALFPGYSLGAFLQFGADIASTVRVVREGTLVQALRDFGVQDVDAFDVDRIGFIGNSLGAVVGASVLTAESDVHFGVQNVPPGSIVETLAESPEFRPIVDGIFLPIFGLENTFDEIDRHLLFDPVIDLSRWILEPVDPLALAPYLLLDPVRQGGPPEILFQVAALDEVAAQLATQSMLDATGSAHVTRYDPAGHGMLEVLDQSSKYAPPAAPPYVLRPVELPILNPLANEHEEIGEFFAENASSSE